MPTIVGTSSASRSTNLCAMPRRVQGGQHRFDALRVGEPVSDILGVLGLRLPALALVEAEGLDVDAGPIGQGPDGDAAILIHGARLRTRVAWRRIWRPAAARRPGKRCAVPRVNAAYRALFWIVCALVLFALGFPYVAPWFY
jgi:hypothetical protein